jgi:hypothetical protein
MTAINPLVALYDIPERLEAKATYMKVSHGMGEQNLFTRTRPCFGMRVKLLILAPFAVVSTHSNFNEG